MNKILWRPSSERIEHANITRFMAQASERYGVELTDYNGLYRWSVENSAEFWSFFWDFADVSAETKGDITVSHFDRMPGAKWFSQARLNYAQNLLEKGESGRFAIQFRSENGTSRNLTYAQLNAKVSSLATCICRPRWRWRSGYSLIINSLVA